MDLGDRPTYIQPSQATDHHPLPTNISTGKGSDAHPPGCTCCHTCYMRTYRHLDRPSHREKLHENGQRHTELWRLSQMIGPDEFTIVRYQRVTLPLEFIHTLMARTEDRTAARTERFPYLGFLFAAAFPTGSKLVTWPRRSIRRWHRKLGVTYTQRGCMFLEHCPLLYLISARRKKSQFNLYVIEAYQGHSPSDFDYQGMDPWTPAWESGSQESLYEEFKRIQDLLGVEMAVIESSYVRKMRNWGEPVVKVFERLAREKARTEEKIRRVFEALKKENKTRV